MEHWNIEIFIIFTPYVVEGSGSFLYETAPWIIFFKPCELVHKALEKKHPDR